MKLRVEWIREGRVPLLTIRTKIGHSSMGPLDINIEKWAILILLGLSTNNFDCSGQMYDQNPYNC